MRPAGLTLRVALAAAAAIVVGVVVLGTAVLARLGDQLEGSLDRSLRERAVEVARLSASTPDLLTEPGTLEGRLGGSELLVQVVDRRGRIVARSSGLGGRVLPRTGGGRYRAAAPPRRISATPGWVPTRSACTPRRSASSAAAARRAAP